VLLFTGLCGLSPIDPTGSPPGSLRLNYPVSISRITRRCHMYVLFLPPSAVIRSILLSTQSNFFSSSYRPAAYMLLISTISYASPAMPCSTSHFRRYFSSLCCCRTPLSPLVVVDDVRLNRLQTKPISSARFSRTITELIRTELTSRSRRA
jgi:hypothetical protein